MPLRVESGLVMVIQLCGGAQTELQIIVHDCAVNSTLAAHVIARDLGLVSVNLALGNIDVPLV